MNTKRLFSMATALGMILLFAGVFFRVIRVDLAPDTLPNFSPLMAAALCGAVFIPGWMGLVVPVMALLLSDAVLNIHYGVPVISGQLVWTLPCYLTAVAIGWSLRSQEKCLGLILSGTLLSSVIFFVVTNTGSWLGLAAYPQNFSGWVQALTTGLPGYPPTWTFFRNSLAGDLLFAAFCVAVERSLATRKAVAIA